MSTENNELTICRIEDSPFTYDELIKMIHASVQERVEQNLNFTVLRMSADDYRDKNKDGYVLVAYRDHDLLGTACTHIYKDGEGNNYSYKEHMFVNPKCKRCGIGTLLQKKCVEIAKSNGCSYIISDTAVGAKSSVKWHLKNGSKIVALRSFPSTNYYSYIFRQQLDPHPKWSNPVYCKFNYLKSAIRCRMYKLPNGDDRKSKWLDLYLKLRGAK